MLLLGWTYTKNGSIWATPKTKIFFSEIKVDYKLSKTFYLIKISNVLAELWIFFLFCVVFFCQKGSFPSITVVWTHIFAPKGPNMEFFKGCVRYIFASLFLSLNESTCQTRKNVFYFTWKALFVLKKIKF